MGSMRHVISALATAVFVAVAAVAIVELAAAEDHGREMPDDPSSETAAAHANNGDAALIERGRYLAGAADCAGCHTAPKGGAPFAGGLGLNSPFGTIVSSNITPDHQYGIGSYSYEDFARTLREGIAKGDKHLYPAMPYPSYSKISNEDMHALYAYFIGGVAPVHAAPAPTRLPFPFNQRWVLGLWNLAFAPTGDFKPRDGRDAQWNRGAYLVQSLGHCGACHTPRGPAFEERGYTEESSLYLTGGTNDHWFAPNLTADAASGLGRIRAEEITAFLKHGDGGGLVPFGSMVQVVEDSTQYMTDDDLAAIARYLTDLPAQKPASAYEPRSSVARMSVQALRTGAMERPGAGIFLSSCAKCHGVDGMGKPNKYPRLAGNPTVLAPEVTSLVRLVVEGGGAPRTEGGPQPEKMPAFGPKLTSQEIAHVLTFVRSMWGNEAAPVTSRDVASLRESIHK